MPAMQWRAEPINSDIVLFLGDLSGDARSMAFAEAAAGYIADARNINLRVLKRRVPETTYVDGRAGAPLSAVKPEGVIFTEFELIVDVLAWISLQLHQFSPVKSGLYQRSHTLFADGIEIDPQTMLLEQIQKAEEFVFINSQPYARKIERGLSTQAPDGVYQAVAVQARRRFSNIAKITFTYRAIVASGLSSKGNRDTRNPAILVRLFG